MADGEGGALDGSVADRAAGALYGAGAIPADWLWILAWRERIETKARPLVERRLAAMRGA